MSGTYFTTLRIYNEIGCSKEDTQILKVGKGYNIMVPNVFTPKEGDKFGINNFFYPIFSGFYKISLSIYDYKGNILFTQSLIEDDIDNPKGIRFTPGMNNVPPWDPLTNGWDGNVGGKPAPYSPYYIYTVRGELFDQETIVDKSGTFILIR